MPKVIVREYDNTTAGIRTSNNFSVVVPGYVGTPKPGFNPDEVFDENGVFECTTQSAFVKYVGLTNATVAEAVAAYGPTFDEDIEKSDFYFEAGDEQKRVTCKPAYDKLKYNSETGTVMISDGDKAAGLFIANQTTKAPGYLVSKDAKVGGTPTLTPADPDYIAMELTAVTDIKDIVFEATSAPEEDAKYAIGDIVNPFAMTAEEIAAYHPTATDTYVRINYRDGKLCTGNDAVQYGSRGNQIAYELLGLGYTVLYKKMTSVDESAKPAAILADHSFWQCLKDKSIYNFRYLTAGGEMSPAIMRQLIAVANFRNDIELEDAEMIEGAGVDNGRGDCIALCDIDETEARTQRGNPNKVIKAIGKAIKAITASKYAAICGPEVIYNFDEIRTASFGGNSQLPCSFHYLACASNAFSKYREWYAVAGYNRGVSPFGIKATTIKLGELAINTLAPRVINQYTDKSANLILCDHGNYFLWGNRTAQTLDNSGLTASHFLNIRQLCTTIKKHLYTVCRQFTFDPNSDILWNNFVNALRPLLETMKADQGIKDYKITKVTNDKKAVLTAKIRIVPIEAVEDFDISIFLEDSLAGITVAANESE